MRDSDRRRPRSVTRARPPPADPVDPAPSKPLDAGTGRVCASFDSGFAAWLSIGMPHPRHGFIELSAVPPFDEAGRGQPAATRAHRLDLTRPEYAFLAVEIDGELPALQPVPDVAAAPAWSSADVHVSTRADPDASRIVQSWQIEASPGPRPRVVVNLHGHLDRPALAEITETDPPRPTGARSTWRIDGRSALLEAVALPADARVTVSGGSVRWTDGGAGRLDAEIDWPAEADRLGFEVAVELGPGPATGDAPPLPMAADDRLTARALAYVRGCTALRTGPEERTILTDHRILPLSWTRDAYWQALALLAADEPGDRSRVADHLRWLWRRCERPDGWWARSHHADGRRKDLAFQADQQLYPILELADFHELTGALPSGVAWDAAVAGAWGASEARVDERLGLLASGENAADDPAGSPFIGASQILRWRSAVRLEALIRAGALALDPRTFSTAAHSAREAFGAAFARGGEPWPYAVDADGAPQAYHDANDLPVALAPAWGFCGADDAGWRSTMSFAFGPTNPGWVAGRRPGLGSAHTVGVWTLGDVQAWIRARALADEAGAAAALGRLEEVAFADGMLPEAYDPDDGSPVRHWFAWPGAALAALRLLEDRRRRMSDPEHPERIASAP